MHIIVYLITYCLCNFPGTDVIQWSQRMVNILVLSLQEVLVSVGVNVQPESIVRPNCLVERI